MRERRDDEAMTTPIHVDTFGRSWPTLGPDDTYCPTCGQPETQDCDHLPLWPSSVKALGGALPPEDPTTEKES